ncbi:unnamed protein product, partial [Acidithrix sp. C25]
VKTIAFYNQKGGVGKTSLAINYAYLASRSGLRTLLWDLDPQASATYVLRVNETLAPRAKALLDKNVSLEDLAIRTNYQSLFIVPASNAQRLLSEKIFDSNSGKNTISRATSSAKGSFDLVVIDSPPSLNSLSDSMLAAIDLLVIPLQPSPLATHSLEALSLHLEKIKMIDRSFTVYNMVDIRRNAHRDAISNHEKLSNIQLLSSYIPYAAEMEKMAIERAPIFEMNGPHRLAIAIESLYFEIQSKLEKIKTRPNKKE